MRIKFQADVNLQRKIIKAVKRLEPTIDFQTADEANLHGLSDDIVLALAASENRILISHDRRTMPYHFAEFVQTQTSPGVFIVSQDEDVKEVADDILLVWFASEPEEWQNSYLTLPLRKNK